MAEGSIPVPGGLGGARLPETARPEVFEGTWLETLHSWVVTVDHKKLGILYVLYALLFLLALPLMPLLGLASSVTAAGILVLRRAGLTAVARRLLATVTVVAVTMAAVSLSPFGRALTTWALD